jgi:hypothetical protein
MGCAASKPAPETATASTAKAAEPNPAPTTKPKPNLESQREPFIDACMESIGSKPYCECGFAQFAEIFRGADFEKAPPKDDPRMEQLAVKMKEACADKFPEAKALEQFVQSCTDGESKRESYCNCAWAELRKSLSISEIIDYPPGSPKFGEAKKAIPKACKGKYPADVALSEYLSACTGSGQKTDKQCQCMWKKILKKYTVEELVAGTGDPTKVPGMNECK